MIIDILYLNRPPRVYKDYSPTLRQNSGELLVTEVKDEGFQIPEISTDRICQKDS